MDLLLTNECMYGSEAYLLLHECVAVVMVGGRPHGRVGVVAEVALRGAGLAPYLGARQHQGGGAVRLERRRVVLKQLIVELGTTAY